MTGRGQPSTDNGKILEPILDHFPTVQAVYLFGSFAQGVQTEESDLDIALLLPRDQASVSLFGSRLYKTLVKRLMREIDLINLRQVSTVFQVQIINTGKLLFSADEVARQTFEMYALSFYQKLNEERAAILKEVYRTGEAYG